MKTRTSLLRSLVLPATLFLATLGVQAAPVTVTVSTFSFTPGSGYGVDADESNGTLLDVVFSSSFGGQSFALDGASASQTFAVGSLQMREQNAMRGIRAAETDNLNVSAYFTFTSPFGSLLEVLATGTAILGSVSDSAVDLTIDWSPVQVAFGLGGLLDVSLQDLVFSGIETLSQNATITLLSAPQVPTSPRVPVTPQTPNTDPPTVSAVPEPQSLALAVLALGGAVFASRRRRG